MTQDSAQPKDELVADFRWLMESPRGRRLVLRLLERTALFRTSVRRGVLTDEPLDLAFAEGQKDIGYRVFGLIQSVCPEKYALMIEEKRTNG